MILQSQTRCLALFEHVKFLIKQKGRIFCLNKF